MYIPLFDTQDTASLIIPPVLRHLVDEMIASSSHLDISKALPRSLSTLPPELLCDIFSYVVARHETHGYVVDAQCLVSLTLVCRSLRGVAQDMLFREVYITNEHQLRAIAHCPPRLLRHVS